ncbi:MAG: hypothetical protein AAF560_01290 [Acidobacteriota bacterium]
MDRGSPSVVALCLLMLAGLASAQPEPEIGRWLAEEVDCPEGTELRRAEAPDGSRSALWCEASRGARVARHGPYLELYPDDTTARQGVYFKGVQAGLWVSWAPDGAMEQHRIVLPGEASRYLLQPEDLCPPGSVRERSFGHDDRPRMWSKCHEIDAEGRTLTVGPYVTWDAEVGPGGAKRYVLRSIMNYENDRRHGLHREFAGPFGREVLIEEETFASGHPDGESRAYYLDGSLRELRNYREGRFDGERVAYFPGGAERWRIVYENDRRILVEGDLSVAGQPCPEDAVPTASADGLELFCARRQLHFLWRDGAFERRDPNGAVVESGLYRNDKKVELWQAPPGVALPPKVSDEVQVAAIQLMLGDQPYTWLNSPPEEDALTEGVGEASGEALEEASSEAHGPAFDIWFRNNHTKKYPHPRTEVEDGVVKIYGLPPGNYYMKVEIDAEPSNPTKRAGDLASSLDFEVALGEITYAPASLLTTLRLIEPWDSNEDFAEKYLSCEGAIPLPPTGEAGARFAWRPPDPEDSRGFEYFYRVVRSRCDPPADLEEMVKASTFDTSIALELPPSSPGEVYEWTLYAKRGEHAIGQMMTFYEGGAYGWSLRFRVE